MERLLNYFTPRSYKLNLKIDKNSPDASATVEIVGVSKSDVVKLHAKGLNIKKAVVDGVETETALDDDVLTLKKAGENIVIDYDFKINRNMEGAYLSTYDYEGTEEKIVATQFESHYAREAFPCVDEPAAKATFDITITTDDPTDTVLSNMPEISGKGATHTFATTPEMSTYLVAFVIGKFNKISTTNKHGVKVTTYGALNQPKTALKFPNQIASEALDLYDDLFGVPYPLEKLDQVAIPDFEAGAMENWGLVTYREACLLVDKNTTKAEREYVATVITHELSHQWFGDLVTMEWWDNLWLNESFANLMQFVSVDKMRPSWHIWQDFFTNDCYYALRRDCLPGVQAVQQPVNDPGEIATLFDSAIVYAKGARLMFMLMRLMGEENFMAGLGDYFRVHAYRNTTGDDLWNALQPYAKFNVKEFMDAWILQPGYPMITDKVSQRFLINGATDSITWPLPEISDDMTGHYLINLSSEEFEDKLKNFDKLSLEQKLRLLIDRMMLAQTPIVSAAGLMDLLPKFKNETSEPVWEILADIIALLKIFFPPDCDYFEKFKKFVYELAEFNLKRLGYSAAEGEDDSDAKLRSEILNFALYARDKKSEEILAMDYDNCLSAKSKAFDRVEKISNGAMICLALPELDSETRGAILLAKFRTSDESIYDDIVEAYQNTADPSLRSDLLGTFTVAKNPENIKKNIALLEKPEIVRPQDHSYLLAYLMSNFYSRNEAFDWFYNNWDYIVGLTSDKSMDDYIRIAAARIRSEEEKDRFFAFVEPKASDPALTRAIDMAKTDIMARLHWLESDTKAVRERLD
ncbi:MAG: M1 family metallopeptidase [Candidatus Saccharibacteria bacterium]|nr:M1 family metallopeptidase [Candidatus Saccharibacteria bacterium]